MEETESMKPQLKPFDIHLFMATIRKAYESWEAPVITLIAKRGGSPFEILVSTLLSLRTRDPVTAEAAERLFGKARTPQAVLALDLGRLKELIYPVAFYPTKAERLHRISEILILEYGAEVPDDMDSLLSLPGVGRKTANLVLVEGFKKEGMCVDTHVHRISNRLGYVKTKTPDQTEFALRKILPKAYWIIYNEILVVFGQTICRPLSPFCSRCPVWQICPKFGVVKNR